MDSQPWRERLVQQLDRLIHRCTVVNIRGESFRLKDRRKAGLFPRAEEQADRPAPFPPGDFTERSSPPRLRFARMAASFPPAHLPLSFRRLTI